MDLYPSASQDIEEQICQFKQSNHPPALDHAYEVAGEIYEQYRNQYFLSDEAKELLYILSQPHIRAAFDVHDRVANKEYLPVLPDVLPQYDDGEDMAIKMVKIIKNSEPLGLTIKKRESDGVIYVARVFVGGPAERSGLIQVGDEVHDVNGIPVKGRSIEQVVHILNSCDGAIALKLVPMPIHMDSPNSRTIMKAYFSYDPTLDLLIPCKDAGLAFKSGEILEVLNTDDPVWWQARLYYDQINKAGLVPSRSLQARRISETFNNSVARNFPSSPSIHRKIPKQSNTSVITHATGSLLSPRLQKKLKKSKKILPQAYIKEGYIITFTGHIEFLHVDEELDAQQMSPSSKLIYEEVQLYKAPPGKKRPIVLIGPSGVGKHDLKTKLVRENSDYATPLPVTSRPKKILETDGKEYSFISRTEMDKLIQNQRLLEYGEYKGYLYGITLDSILDLTNSGKVCVLTCQAQSISFIRCAAIKPYTILIKPPVLEKLKLMKIYSGEKSAKKLTVYTLRHPINSNALRTHRRLKVLDVNERRAEICLKGSGGSLRTVMFCKEILDINDSLLHVYVSINLVKSTEMEAMVLDAARIESLFGELCDDTITNTEFSQTYKKLTTLCQTVYTDEKWVPSSWLNT